MAITINGSGTVTGLAVGGLPDGTVDAGTLATDSVTAAKIAADSVDSAELIDGAVDDSHIAALASSKLTGALPAISGASLTNVAINGSAFAAYNSSGQSISTGGFTKIIMNTEEFDLNNEYDNSTNYRFTPTVAGYYQINGQFRIGSVGGEFFISLSKNGSQLTRGTNQLYGSTSSIGASILSQIVYLNGSGDYLEMFAYQASGGNLTLTGGRSYTLFQGYFVRGA